MLPTAETATMTIKRWAVWRFTPQPDITAYDLARILAVTGGVTAWQETPFPVPHNFHCNLTPELIRHFTREE